MNMPKAKDKQCIIEGVLMPEYLGYCDSGDLVWRMVMILKMTLTPDKVGFNPIALRMAKTLWSFGHSECNRDKVNSEIILLISQ